MPGETGLEEAAGRYDSCFWIDFPSLLPYLWFIPLQRFSVVLRYERVRAAGASPRFRCDSGSWVGISASGGGIE